MAKKLIHANAKDIDTLEVGKKAESLFAMKQAGFNVPAFFVVPASWHHDFLEANKFEEKLKEIFDNLTPETAAAKSLELKELINSGEFSAAALKEIKEELGKFEAKSFAVRSSGINEDMPDNSFAGQYDSFLNANNFEDIVASIIKCFASIYNERILNYSLRNQIPLNHGDLAVIVQELVPAESSGVAFSINPIKGFDHQVLINASYGLGEAIVSGIVSPDMYIYDWMQGEFVEKQLSVKEVSIESDENFTKKVAVSEELKATAVLTDEQIVDLANTIVDIQAFYGFPVDVEWSYSGLQLFILQSRPVTNIKYAGIEGEWTTADFKDGGISATVCKTLMWSLYRYTFESIFPVYFNNVGLLDNSRRMNVGEMFYGRGYWKVSAIKECLEKTPGFIERDFDEDLGVEITYEGKGVESKTTLKTLITGLIVLFKMNRAFQKQLTTSQAFKEKQLAKLANLDYSRLNDSNLNEEYRKFILEGYYLSESSYFYQIFNNTMTQSLFKEAIAKYISKSEIIGLMGGLTNLSHLLPTYMLFEMSREIRKNDEESDYYKKNEANEIAEDYINKVEHASFSLLADFINKFGYHSVHELDISVPNYDEDIEYVVSILKKYAELEDSKDPHSIEELQVQKYQQLKEQVLNKIPKGKRKEFDKKIEDMRQQLWWREELRDLSTRYYHEVRKHTVLLGDKLFREKVIDAPEDVHFLGIDQLCDFFDGKIDSEKVKQLVVLNKIYYASFRNFANSNDLGSRYSKTDEGNKSKLMDTKILKGIACSGGKVTGIARVIKDIEDSKRLVDGDILITKFTDPAWTSKFGLLKGVATETGGVLSHAAVISREYGIACVLAVKNITSIVKDGQTIIIDADKGEIELHD